MTRITPITANSKIPGARVFNPFTSPLSSTFGFRIGFSHIRVHLYSSVVEVFKK